MNLLTLLTKINRLPELNSFNEFEYIQLGNSLGKKLDFYAQRYSILSGNACESVELLSLCNLLLPAISQDCPAHAENIELLELVAEKIEPVCFDNFTLPGNIRFSFVTLYGAIRTKLDEAKAGIAVIEDPLIIKTVRVIEEIEAKTAEERKAYFQNAILKAKEWIVAELQKTSKKYDPLFYAYYFSSPKKTEELITEIADSFAFDARFKSNHAVIVLLLEMAYKISSKKVPACDLYEAFSAKKTNYLAMKEKENQGSLFHYAKLALSFWRGKPKVTEDDLPQLSFMDSPEVMRKN